MDVKRGVLGRLIERKIKERSKNLQTQRQDQNLSIKLFSRMTSIIKAPICEFKDDNDFSKRKSIQDMIDVIDYKRTFSEENSRKAIELFKNHNRTLIQNQFFIKFLMQLEPFNQIVSESANADAEDIIRVLSFILRYEFAPKHTALYKFGEYSDKFYLILNGEVDIIVPNEEEIELTEEEYFLYLLKLRQYNELQLLNKALVKNSNAFYLEEKNFDNWVKIAYNTLLSIKSDSGKNENQNDVFVNQDPAIILKPNKNISNSPARSRLFRMKNADKFANRYLSPRYSPKRRRKQPIMQYNDSNSKKQVFITNEKKELVLCLESDIISTMKVIDPNFEDEFLIDHHCEKSQNMISTEEYINRTKPIKLNYDFNATNQRVTVSSYFLAHRMYTGDKFGEMMNDVNQINTTNQRVSTILTSTDCEFGVLDKEGYNNCLKDSYERIRKIKLNYLLQIKLFKRCNKSLFMKSFSNFFIKRTFQSQDTIFTENSVQEDIMSVYLIRDGEFVAEWNKSLNDIDFIISRLNYSWLLPSDDEGKYNSSLKRFMKKKTHWKLQYFSNNDVIGLNDALIDKKYLYSVKCSSSQATVYEIRLNYFKMVTTLDPVIAENVKNYEAIRRNVMIKFLVKQKKQKLETFKKINKEIFENQFTYVKKEISAHRKMHTTINRKCKTKALIAVNRKKLNLSNETSINKDYCNTASHINHQVFNTTHTCFANAISNITLNIQDNSIKTNLPHLQFKNPYNKTKDKAQPMPSNINEKEENGNFQAKRLTINKDKKSLLYHSNTQFDNSSKAKEYYTSTVESEPKLTAINLTVSNKLSPESIFSKRKDPIFFRGSLNFDSMILLSKLTQPKATKLDTIFHSLSKNKYKNNKNTPYYSSLSSDIYLNK